MTFSQSVKSEILKSVKKLSGCCATSFLTAVLKSVGSLSLGFKGFAFTVESDNPEFLDVCKRLANKELGVDSIIETYNVNAKGSPVYSCKFDGSIGEKLGLTKRDSNGVLELCDDVQGLLPKDDCCKRAFMQGLFVACGSVVIPLNEDVEAETADRVKYHLELRFTDSIFANAVNELYSELPFRALSRKNTFVLYQKDSEKISDFLVYLNATVAMLKLENVMAVRAARNVANRRSNCTYANIEKAVAAAQRQLDAIELLKQKGTFDGLPDNLKEIALLREKYPESTLDEIADMLHISKSGANHRFAKLIELSNR